MYSFYTTGLSWLHFGCVTTSSNNKGPIKSDARCILIPEWEVNNTFRHGEKTKVRVSVSCCTLYLYLLSLSLHVCPVQTKLKIIKLFWSLSEMITRNNCIYACPVLIASFAQLHLIWYSVNISFSDKSFKLFIKEESEARRVTVYFILSLVTAHIPGVKDWNKFIKKCWKSPFSQHFVENTWKIA